MVFTDTKLHTEIIKELFWNFHLGHYVSVSHLDSVNALLGIGIVIPQNSNLGGSNTLPNAVPSHQHHRSNSTTEIYGTTKAANMRHISHV